MKKAFTLAEIMIVLIVIGVLTAVLLPIAFQAAPDENVMKFKKANSTLGTVIRELVNSDRYYQAGYLGKRANGTAITADSDDNYRYFCRTMSELLSTRAVNCSNVQGIGTALYSATGDGQATDNNIATLKGSGANTSFDGICAQAQATIGSEIITADGVSWFQANPRETFGRRAGGATGSYMYAPPTLPPSDNLGQTRPYDWDVNNFDRRYKIMCFDVDGVNTGEAPFGYGIRGDGKIIPGGRADAWIQLSTQRQD